MKMLKNDYYVNEDSIRVFDNEIHYHYCERLVIEPLQQDEHGQYVVLNNIKHYVNDKTDEY